MDIGISDVLLFMIVILQLALISCVKSILKEVVGNAKVANAYNNDHINQREEFFSEQAELVKEISNELTLIKYDIDEIKQVADIFYKYKLPDSEDRKFLDQVRLDKEVSEGIVGKRQT